MRAFSMTLFLSHAVNNKSFVDSAFRRETCEAGVAQLELARSYDGLFNAECIHDRIQ